MRFAPLVISTALALATPALLVGVPGAATGPSVSTFSTVVPHARGLAADASGRMYVTSRAPNAKIYRCTPPDTTMTLFASGFADPIDMVFDDTGNMFVTDFAGYVYKVTPAGVVSQFGPTLNNPGSLTRDAAGNLYVGEYFTRRIVKLTPAGVMTVYVASMAATVGSLVMLNMDTDGTLYVAGLNGGVYKVGAGGSPVTSFCSTTGPCMAFLHDGSGAGWFGDTYDGQQLIQISSGGAVTSYSGAYLVPNPNTYINIVYRVDGDVTVARFNWPSSIILLGGIAYVAEYANNDVRAITPGPTPTRGETWGRLKALYR